MTDTRTLTDRDEIRDWAAARAGRPAIQEGISAIDSEPVLRLVFGQRAYADNDWQDRSGARGGLELVDWDEWFELFNKRHLALVVSKEVPGQHDQFHEIVRRADDDE